MSYLVDKFEQVDIKMILDKLRSVERHRLALGVLLPYKVPSMNEGDKLEVTWSFVIQYLFNTAIALEAINSICDDPEVILDVDCKALKEGEILIYSVLSKLQALMYSITQREKGCANASTL